jgi:glycerophosphoryl diester phosphodiesterase
VVMHDPNVARTTDGSGEIGSKSLAEIRKLDASARWFGVAVGPQAVPTLQEVLDLVKGRCDAQIEIKVRTDGSRYAGIERKVVEAVRRGGIADRVVVLSFDYPTLVDVKSIDPGIRTCALVNKASLTAIGKNGTAVGAEMKRLGADFVGVDKAVLTPALYNELRSAGLGVGVWTVDDEKLMRQFAAMGVDFVTSNRPDLLRSEFPSAVP